MLICIKLGLGREWLTVDAQFVWDVIPRRKEKVLILDCFVILMLSIHLLTYYISL